MCLAMFGGNDPSVFTIFLAELQRAEEYVLIFFRFNGPKILGDKTNSKMFLEGTGRGKRRWEGCF